MIHTKWYIGMALGLLLAVFGMPKPCPADDTIVFGSVADAPPMSFEENGVARGIFSDVFREVARRIGLDATISLYPFKRLDAYLRSGELDGNTATAYAKERDGYLVFSKSPVFISRSRVFVKKGKEFPFNGIRDLFGKKVGVMAGWPLNNSELAQAVQAGNIQVDEAPGYDQNLQKMMMGRVDCFIASEQATWYHAARAGMAGDLVAIGGKVAELAVYFAVSKYSKKVADPHALITKMDAALDEILADGTYETLLKKYNVTQLK